jgi:hypothetical protein
VNRWGYLGLAIILIVIAVFVYQLRDDLGLGSHARGAKQQVAANGQSKSPNPAEISWHKIDRTIDGFQIEMPANVQETKIPAYDEHGGAEQADMLYAYPDPKICYSVTWEEDPPVERINKHVPDRTLDMALTNALDRSQTMLLNRSDISQQGFPGRDFSARNSGGGVINSRLVLARHRLYMLTAAYPSADARSDRDVARFFSSFSIVAPSPNN